MPDQSDFHTSVAEHENLDKASEPRQDHKIVQAANGQLPAPIPQAVRWPAWRRITILFLIVAAAVGGGVYWLNHSKFALPVGIVSGNGRIEADEIDIATKFAGRVAEVLVDEGSTVAAGQVVARMDTRDLQASLKKAQSQVKQAQRVLDEVRAIAAQQQTQFVLAQQELDRTESLMKSGFSTQELLDQRRQQFSGATASLHAANARVEQAEHALEASRHDVDLLQINISDNALIAPRDGRVQYRIANVGEVLPAGGKVFTMLDLNSVYMDIYLPTADTGRTRIGDSSRIVLDAYPHLAIPAKVSFISDQAQFTPKAVETKSERDKLMFRVRVRIDPERLRAHREAVKSGVPGVAYVLLDPKVAWPRLAARIRWSMNEDMRAIARIESVIHRYRAIVALDSVSLEVPAGKIVGIVGPDGVGKSTLLSIIAGARRIQSGQVYVFDGDMRDAEHRRLVCPRIAYMPQGLGRNLYPDLTVRENIEFFARLFEQSKEEREKRIAELLDSTGLSAFCDRPAKALSGGMRQKLGLCCALIHDPDFLILDEPTTGVDPLSRRQFWDLIGRMRDRHPGMSVMVATAYMEEAEHFDWLIAMNAGRILAANSPDKLKVKTGAKTIEEAFIALLPRERRAGHQALHVPPRVIHDGQPVIVARELTRRFGKFIAVNRVNFTIERGEIFGFVGSNGCGKTTTMKMLTGLLEPSEGVALLFGQRLDASDMQSRKRVGYMSQSFSLYSELTVRQNLDLHARLFHIPAAKSQRRIERLVEQFELRPYLDQETTALPLGIRQRLSLAVAIVHEPEMLILDEPTSGVDPLARDQFWELLIDLSRNQGVTIFVSTHFMNEAGRCDRVALMDAGRMLATDSPSALQKSCNAASLEEAFINYLEKERGEGFSSPAEIVVETISPPAAPQTSRFSTRRFLAYAIRETLELIRDPIRLGFALGGSALLMLIFGFGISTDVDNLSFAVLDHDHTSESRAYISGFTGSRYFIEKKPVSAYEEVERRLKDGDVKAIIEIPPNFGRDIKSGRPTSVAAWIDGAMPYRAETIRGYIQATHAQFVAGLQFLGQTKAAPLPAALVETRFRYNQDFDSVYAMVPSSISLLLALIPAILMALAIVREKELGSIINLYVTPVTRIEFLIGKQLPYIGLAMVNFALMFLMALFLFRVPLKGSFLTLLLGALLYVTTTTAYGMVISAFARTQIAALFGTAILTMLPATQFAGLMTPVSSLSGGAAIMGRAFPMSYFVPISVGTFTKGLGFSDLDRYLLSLAMFIPVFLLLNLLLLRKQQT